MNCLEIDRILQNYFDGELSAQEMALVQNHLGRCASCRRAFQQVKMEIRDLLVDVAEPRVSLETIRDHIQQNIQALRPRHPLPLPMLTVSASFLLAIGFAWLLFQAPKQDFDELSDPRFGNAVRIQDASFQRENESILDFLQQGTIELEMLGALRDTVPTFWQEDGQTAEVKIHLLHKTKQSARYRVEGLRPGLYQLQIEGSCHAISLQAGENPAMRLSQ